MKRLKLRTKIICSFGAVIVLCCFFVMIVVFTDLPPHIMAIFAVAALIATTALALFMANHISKPLEFFADAIQGIARTGNIYLDDKAYKTTKHLNKRGDEIGQISRSVGDMLAMFRSKIQTLNAVANGDLTAEIVHRSEKDTIGAAMTGMVNSLNGMFVEIQSVAYEVSDGSIQLADGATALAHGAGEQASVVEQLSSSISSIAGMTTHNAEMAREAAGLSGDIKKRAETGGEQMSEMIKAVNEINSASEAIGKVIKVIDDIAFQTNILALNAAVEAARAGQHGKGFAVVAQEVRNLAAKSAEAAKDTGSLIADSITKAQLGSKIANETAASLHEIVDGVNKSAQLAGEIAHFSDEQASAIKQINNGIEQVNRVVRQNNETAEQSASACKEVSGQSAFLEELIARFKIKGALPKGNHSGYIEK